MVQIDGSVTDHEEHENFFRQGDSFEEAAGRQPRSLVPIELEERRPLTEEELLRAARFRKPVTAIVSSLLLAFLLALAIRERRPSETLASAPPRSASPTEAALAAASDTSSAVVEPQAAAPLPSALATPLPSVPSNGSTTTSSVPDSVRESQSASQADEASHQPAGASVALDRPRRSLGKATARAHVPVVKSSSSVAAPSGAPSTPLPSQGRFPDAPR
ncbi:MAG TPA: hypothetical protein VK745_31975 [Polyangiaceae bacterium]|jgi:hypothetical protein|nr:hypothetical protein [Polyangiaceae bacterium]